MDKKYIITEVLRKYGFMPDILYLEKIAQEIVDALDKTEKPFPVSECCSAGARVEGDKKEGTMYYVCTNCLNPCDLKEWSKPKPSPAKVPEKLKNFTAGYQESILADKINDLIDWANGVEERLK